MAPKVLRLPPDQADWLARAACYLIQDAGEGFHSTSHFNVEMFEVDHAASGAAGAAEMILELRAERSTTNLALAESVTERFGTDAERYLGGRHLDVVEARSDRRDRGRFIGEIEKERDRDTREAMLSRDILAAIKAHDEVAGEEG
jgi:hypothetical protein